MTSVAALLIGCVWLPCSCDIFHASFVAIDAAGSGNPDATTGKRGSMGH
jgi:hypothetical protein